MGGREPAGVLADWRTYLRARRGVLSTPAQPPPSSKKKNAGSPPPRDLATSGAVKGESVPAEGRTPGRSAAVG